MLREHKRIHHYHIRKTAGTSLNAAFWALAGLDLSSFGSAVRLERDGFVFIRHDAQLINAGAYFFSNAHIPAYDLSLPRDTFTITILRDPLARICSHYRYLRWAQEDLHDHSGEPFIGTLKRESEWLGKSFADFIRNIPKCHLMHQLHMFSEHYDVAEATARIAACNSVCFTETFSRDLADLGRSLGLPLHEKHERRFGDRLHFSSADLELAREVLAPEFALIESVRRLRTC